MSLHKEISFESEICQHLASHGWLHAKGDAAGFRNISRKTYLIEYGFKYIIDA